MSFISSYCHISNKTVSVNGKAFFSADKPDSNLTKEVYKQLGIDYPKFYKMDTLSKVAFLGVEILKKQYPQISDFKDDEIALLFGNKHASAETDIQFLNSYKDGNSASPALFVYTLPNILIGEIAIRNKWYGENLFTVYPKFNAELFEKNCTLFLTGKTKACLCGWVDVLGDSIEAFLFFVEKAPARLGANEKNEGGDVNKLNFPCKAETLKNIYNKQAHGKPETRIKETNN